MIYMRWLLLLSFMDAFCTDRGLRAGVIGESNPIALWMYETHVSLFYGWKVALPFLLMVLYPKIQHHTWIRRGALATFGLYVALFCYHVFWITYVMAM